MGDNNSRTATRASNLTAPTGSNEIDDTATSMNAHSIHCSRIDFTSDRPSSLKRTQKPTATIVLIGETGSGKTAFMSLLINLLQGKRLLELEDLHVVNNETGLELCHSQTAAAVLYTITTLDGFELRILDTPGLSDTRGTDYDQEHRASINQAIKDNIPSVDAIIIVANGSVERLSAATENTLSAISTLFPRSLAENVGLMFTNCEPATRNFRLETLPQSLIGNRHWSIQNSLALVRRYRAEVDNLVEAGISEARLMRIERDFPDIIATLNRWLEWLDDRQIKPTKEINDLYDQYFDIDTKINTLLALLRELSERRTQLQDISTRLEQAKSFTGSIDEEIQQQKDAVVWELKADNTDAYHAVCVQKDCHSNCQSVRVERILQTMRWSSLGLISSPRTSSIAGRSGLGCVVAGLGAANTALALNRGIMVMYAAGAAGGAGMVAVTGTAYWTLSKVKCEICGHSVTRHELSKMTYVSKPGEVNQATEQQFKVAQTNEEAQRRKKKEVQQALDQTQAQMRQIQSTINELVTQYNQIALGNDYAGHIHSAIKYCEQHEARLTANPGAAEELKCVRESIVVLKEKLKALTQGGQDLVQDN